jgi:hypothetical protein
MANWPDGTPRRGANDAGSVGGTAPDGHALRHSDGTEPPAENFGWLNGVAGVIGNPSRGGPEVRIGPGSPVWDRAPPKFTTGDQRRGRKR